MGIRKLREDRVEVTAMEQFSMMLQPMIVTVADLAGKQLREARGACGLAFPMRPLFRIGGLAQTCAPPKNVFSKNLRLVDTKERSKITTPTRDDDDDDQRPPPFTSSLLPPQEGINCWMATWEPVNRQQSRYHKSQGAHLDCCRFSPEVVPFEKKWYDYHNSRSTTMVLPLATLTAHSAIHPSLQAPPPHP